MSNGANSNQTNDGFQKVTYKKGFPKVKSTQILKTQNCQPADSDFDEEVSIRRINKAKSEIVATGFLDSVKALLKEGLSPLNNPKVSEIICVGLGSIGECAIARYQLALLLCLKELYNADVYAYDPIFNRNDVLLLNQFDIIALKENSEGKYKVRNQNTTLFYLPHCSKQLTNNLLWANWGLDLTYCVIIANSFNEIVENSSIRTLVENAEYISKITPYVLELSVINTFKYYDVFNDTSIHVFPRLNLISPDLWENCLEPKYSYTFQNMAAKLSVLRQIISELRYTLPQDNLKNNLALRHILDQYKKYKTTDQQLCKAQEEMNFIAKTYLCYLKSSRLELEIHNEFHGKGERSVAETANMVGFKLPHDPK